MINVFEIQDQPQMLYFFLKGLFNPDTSHYQDAETTSLVGTLLLIAPTYPEYSFTLNIFGNYACFRNYEQSFS